jgi:uncharacterized protein (DUF1330 family)
VTPAKTPPAYLIGEIEVTDPEGYKKYQDGVSAVLGAIPQSVLLRADQVIE